MNPELCSLKSWCLARTIQKCSYTKSIETMQHSIPSNGPHIERVREEAAGMILNLYSPATRGTGLFNRGNL